MSKDPRTRRVEDALTHHALEHLTRAGWEDLTAPKLCASAGVSRSTLYARFGSLEEVILAGLLGLFEQAFPKLTEQDALLDPDSLLAGGKPLSYPVFAHVHEHWSLYETIFGDPRGAPVIQGLERAMAEASSNLHAPLRAAASEDLDPGLVSHLLAGALVGVLRWWLLDAAPAPSPLAMSYQFSRLVAPGVLAAMGLEL